MELGPNPPAHLKLITNAHVYAPDDIGIQHILVAAGKIIWMGASLPSLSGVPVEQIDLQGQRVLPGFIDSLPEKEEFRERIPMQRYGKTEEVSSLVAFLASEGAAYITGQNIRIDGGITRSV